ncbi:MAG TPA: response regulator [Candidatus Xenobia bacterium]|jgi:signal transduction histidine kinase/DNA-binding response OmpR family regulator
MRISLRLYLTALTFTLVVGIAVVNLLGLSSHEMKLQREEYLRRADAIARLVAMQAAFALKTRNYTLLQSDVASQFLLRDVILLEVVDPEGQILAHKDPTRIHQVETDPWAVRNVQNQPLHDRSRFETESYGEILQVIEPVDDDQGRRLGNVRLDMSLQTLNAAVQAGQKYLQSSTLVFVGVALLGVYLLASWWARPLMAMVSVARRLGQGRLSERAPERSSDEVGVLARDFNRMATELERLVKEEREKKESLIQRVQDLLELTRCVSKGDLKVRAQAEGQDDLARLAHGFNTMVERLSTLMADEQEMRTSLERSKRAQEIIHGRLQEMDRQKSEFLETVSHELRTPLTSIKAFSELLLDDGEDPEIQTEFLGIIQQETERLTHLINNLLDLSRIEAGRVRWKHEEVDVARLIHETYHQLDSAVERKRLKIRIEAPDPLVVLGDEEYLIQIFWNLLANAVKFTPEGGSITLTGIGRADEVEVVVEDTGIGIPARYHAAVFDKFWRVPESHSHMAKGSGLGLAVARAIVRAHAGHIELDSEPNKGARFSVVLPRRPAVEQETLTSALPAGPYRLLLVSDKDNLVGTLRAILEMEGHTVAEERESDKALDHIRDYQPDAVFIDAFMEGGAGFDLLHAMRTSSDLHRVPVWTLSLLEGRQSFNPTAQDFFRKPPDPSRLLAAITRLTSKQKSSPRILVVDDDPSVVNALTQLLSTHGYQTLRAYDGIEAVVKSRDEGPDLIILDVYMPHMNGLEVIRRLRGREDTARIPIILLTASDVQLDRARMLEELSADSPEALGELDLAEAVRHALATLTRPAEQPTLRGLVPPVD